MDKPNTIEKFQGLIELFVVILEWEKPCLMVKKVWYVDQ